MEAAGGELHKDLQPAALNCPLKDHKKVAETTHKKDENKREKDGIRAPQRGQEETCPHVTCHKKRLAHT